MAPPESEFMRDAVGVGTGDADLARARAELARALPGLKLAYVFGSRAAGRSRVDSDVDLAVLCDVVVDPLALYGIAQIIAGALRREVDLVDLARASTVLQKEVVAQGKVLHEREPGMRLVFESRVLSDYARLNEERAPVLERIAREGRVHG